jgi:hypothetical protein
MQHVSFPIITFTSETQFPILLSPNNFLIILPYMHMFCTREIYLCYYAISVTIATNFESLTCFVNVS